MQHDQVLGIMNVITAEPAGCYKQLIDALQQVWVEPVCFVNVSPDDHVCILEHMDSLTFSNYHTNSIQPVPPEHTFTGAHLCKHDYPCSHSGRMQLVSKLIPPQHTTTSDNNLPTDPDSDANADYVHPSQMDVSDAEAPLCGDEGYDSGRDHDMDANGSDADTNGSDADEWNGVYADYDHGIDSAEGD
ncbi:uncharacterized protein BJ212DRAFT_1474542 [Suillus subaureus]|uniref:Uncharacterized protein n=1 Tax=Suillus subaureus TaxID=48587 RepID=A0A9P7EQ04_9AGAM|nr:uncharacterized protein BJ212DRAFT_1474542 [Suillus subaureus]KAG1827387.1 hypothetical protein BJ212DRAFT_1474542 [Suillus subaureus]